MGNCGGGSDSPDVIAGVDIRPPADELLGLPTPAVHGGNLGEKELVGGDFEDAESRSADGTT
jgi:hypothetical protein